MSLVYNLQILVLPMIVVSLRESLLNIVYIMCALSCKRISLYVVSTKCLSYSVLNTIQTGTSRSTPIGALPLSFPDGLHLHDIVQINNSTILA